MMLGTKFYKDNLNDELYFQCAEWCNNNNATIEDKGKYYECVAIPPASLEEVKARKLQELKQNRDVSEQVSVSTEKGTFDVDDKSLSRISNAIMVLQISGQTLDWTLADNTVVQVTAQDLQSVIISLALQSNQVHEKYRILKEQVEECTTVEEVQSIYWDIPDQLE